MAKAPEQTEQDLDRLALHLERGRTLAAAARAMKIEIWRAEYLFGVMQARLGPQAMEE